MIEKVCIALVEIDRRAALRPPEYRAAVLAVARQEGARLCFHPDDYRRIRAEYRLLAPAHGLEDLLAANPAAPPPPEPTLVELATNFTGALGRWISAGAPVATAEVYATRSAACDLCPHWNGSARLGLGKCSAPGCGCTSLKRWLATEKCPLGKW